jgi:FtsH-binding integral membrane protein
MYNFNLKIINDCLTETDNTTYCMARVAFAIAVTSFICMSAYGMYMNKTCNLSEFATGITMILGSGGASIALKSIKNP